MNERFVTFVTGITICYKYIQRIKSAEMAELGLKGPHTMCLFYLHHYDGITAAQLCQLCVEDKAAISRALSTLQKLGYLQQGEKKYRAKLRLTPAGVKVAQRLDELVKEWVDIAAEGVSEEDNAISVRTLDIVANNLRERMTQLKKHNVE